MAPDSLHNSPSGRLRWALRDGLIVGGMSLFWLDVTVILVGFLSVLSTVLHLIGVRSFHHVAEALKRGVHIWLAFSSNAFLTAGLYAVVRAGTRLIDHYRATVSECRTEFAHGHLIMKYRKRSR